MATDPLVHPASPVPTAQEQALALQFVQQATQREQLYRYIIHYWRVVHRLLALLTVGLVGWHLIYVAQLLVPRLFQHP